MHVCSVNNTCPGIELFLDIANFEICILLILLVVDVYDLRVSPFRFCFSYKFGRAIHFGLPCIWTWTYVPILSR